MAGQNSSKIVTKLLNPRVVSDPLEAGMKFIPFKDFYKLFLMKSKEKMMENDFLAEIHQNQRGRLKKNRETNAKIQSAMNVSKRRRVRALPAMDSTLDEGKSLNSW